MSKLGYSKYMVQGGDWGHFVARELGARYTESCKLVHFNFAPAGLPDEGVGRTDEEQNLAVRADDFLENHLGYAVCMRTRVSIYMQLTLHRADLSSLSAAYNRTRTQ
jgi:hypothetical protein